MKLKISRAASRILAGSSIALGSLCAMLLPVWSDAPADIGPAPRADLGGAGRRLTYLSTDKPVYRTGERVYLRGVILDAATRIPLSDAAAPHPQALVQIVGPKGDVAASGYVASADSVLGFAWDVPAEQAGGEYTAKVTYPFDGYTPAERKFDVRAYRAPRLKSQIVFLRDGYGPGDAADATLHVERAEGGVPQGAKITATARVDGVEAWTGPASVDAAGNCTVNFKLPATIERGEGTLSFAIEDGGVVETAAKTIPILLQTVDLGIYPEGGDLVAGLPNRVYLEGRTPAKKPADLVGVVVDGAGKEVATFRTEHEGRGRFEFTPARGEKYALRISQPAGIKKLFDLPAVKDDGVTLRAERDVVGKDEPVKLTVASAPPRKLKVTLSKRETEVAAESFAGGAAHTASLTPPTSADGVLVATVWDENGNPLAERLVFRQPAKSVNVKVTASQSKYVPGGSAELTVTTTDDAGKPIGTTVGLTVTDDSVLEMIEKRERAPRLPAMVLLENDVRELADAHVYLDPANPKAALATDLLLGTQGWRRFAFVKTAEFLGANGDAGQRVLALRLPPPPALTVLAAGAADGFADAPDAAAAGRGGAGPRNAWKFDRAKEPLGEARREPADVKKDEARADAPAAVSAAPAPAAAMPPPALKHAAGPMTPPAAAEPVATTPPAEQAQLQKALAGRVMKDEQMRLMPATQPAQMRNDFIPVRVYAHAVRAGRQPSDRADFAETLFWNAGVRTDDATGRATVSFALSDAVTSFRVAADAFDAAGALGSGSAAVESVKPFYVEPKLPLEVTQGDVIRLPIGVVNGTTGDLPDARITVSAGRGGVAPVIAPFTLKANSRDRRIVELTAANAGTHEFTLRAAAGPYADDVTRPLVIRPRGFPAEIAFGGMMPAGGKVIHEIVIPANCIPGSVTSTLSVYPTPLANLTDALERLIQEPSGCFEQTSSTCYPLVMAQQYFLTHTGVDPKLIERSRANLDSGYQKLSGFECKQRGYEWFGGDPGHEALTAYGLLEFTDMAQVRTVDPAMVQRTRQWLLDRRDGKGGFARNARALDSFGGAPPETTDAYCVWALLESGQTGLDKEAAAVKELGVKSDDTYVVALAANVAALQGDKAAGKALMDRLLKKQAATGAVDGATTSITRSGGESLVLETTALSVLAWLRDPTYAAAVERSMNWLAESCKAGRFGSTQSTILCLRAIVAYDQSRATPRAPGTVQVVVDGHPMGNPAPFTPDTRGAIKLADVSEMMSPGKHAVELRMAGGSAMPYAVAVNYHDTQPASAGQCKVKLDVALRDKELPEAAVTEADVTVTNTDKVGVPTPIAIIGIPGGLEVRHDQLKELVKSGKVDAYEVKGREVILYWRELKAGQQARLPISLVAAVPGNYTAPASRAYLYYTDEFKHWVGGAQVTITPRAAGAEK